MKFDRQLTAALAVIISVGVGGFVGCNNPASVDDTGTVAPVYSKSQQTCPTIDELVDAIVEELNANCPITEVHRNWGQENSCEKGIIGNMVDAHQGCFSGPELKIIRQKVFAIRNAPPSETRLRDPRNPQDID